MEIKNLARAAEIAEDLPKLEEARTLLSDIDEDTRIELVQGEPGQIPTKLVELPRSIHMNIINILNLEINSLKEEAKKL